MNWPCCPFTSELSCTSCSCGINIPEQSLHIPPTGGLGRQGPTQGSNPGFPHCRQIFYQLSHKGSPKKIICLLHWLGINPQPPMWQVRILPPMPCQGRALFGMLNFMHASALSQQNSYGSVTILYVFYGNIFIAQHLFSVENTVLWIMLSVKKKNYLLSLCHH